MPVVRHIDAIAEEGIMSTAGAAKQDGALVVASDKDAAC
jgi:hypothetical protein